MQPSSRKGIYCYYRGTSFRSRLEARYQMMFEDSGIEAEYEYDQIVLSDGTQYRPDFWLPDFRCYAEIKPCLADIKDKEASKLIRFVFDRHALLLFHERPGYNRPAMLGMDARKKFESITVWDAAALDKEAGYNPARLLRDPHKVISIFEYPYDKAKEIHLICDRANNHKFSDDSEDAAQRGFDEGGPHA